MFLAAFTGISLSFWYRSPQMTPFYIRWLLFAGLFIILACPHKAHAQCSTGQDPATAFPICGYATFQQATVPACDGKTMVVPNCNASQSTYKDVNAFWYKFTCYTSGTLGFLIEPVLSTDDYDWQLFDVTGVNVAKVYTDQSLVVTGNWSGTYGNTGAKAGGLSYIQCGSDPVQNLPTFSAMPNLVAGHNYLLMISHFTAGNQSGYSLSFSGGTASITDPNLPHLQTVSYDCNTRTIRVKTTTNVQCSSLATNGSDFTLNTSGISITSATGIGCSNGFDMDSLVLKLNQPLPAGNYALTMQTGSDANTLLDYCNRDIPAGEHIDFTVTEPPALEIDSINALPCAPDSLQLVFTQPVDCSTFSADGSEFTVSGPSQITVVKATGNCSSGITGNTVTIYFDKRITTPGTYTITIGAGDDGNTLASLCGRFLITGNNTISFDVPVQPVSLIKRVMPVECRTQKIRLALTLPVQCSSVAADGSDFYITGSTAVTITSASSNCLTNNLTDTIDLYFSAPVLTAGNYKVNVQTGSDGNTLLTSCYQQTPVGNYNSFSTQDTVNAGFTYSLALHCETDSILLYHNGANGVNKWSWYFDGNDSSQKQNPVKTYTRFGTKNITLVVTNGVCSDTSSQQIILTNVLEAAFSLQHDTICPNNAAVFYNESVGNIVAQEWTFGNGNTSILNTPQPQTYTIPTVRDQLYNVQLIVQSAVNCFDTVVHAVHVLNSCYIAVPSGFTPNGDGRNDYLYPLNGFKTSRLDFKVYNRLGQLVFHATRPEEKWDGTLNGEQQPPGTFVWMLSYTDADTGQTFFTKGTTVLIR